MNDFQFLLPDGSYATTDRSRFSAAYATGAVPIEALPNVQVMSPQGLLETKPHRDAASLIQTQGYRLVKQTRPLQFVPRTGASATCLSAWSPRPSRRAGNWS